LENADETWRAKVLPEFALTSHNWPVKAFSGWPSPGGLNLGSLHDPVHVGGSAGSVCALSMLSL
jgi:hypothetical protein